MTEILALLERDHRHIDSLLHGLTMHEDDRLHEVGLELQAHTEAEDTTFYSILSGDTQSAAHVSAAQAEHRQLRSLFLDLAAASATGFVTAEQNLKDALRHHFDEEEGPVFSRARQIFTVDQMLSSGVEYERQKQLVKGRMHSRPM